MKKQLLTQLLSLTILISLVSCDKNDDPGPRNPLPEPIVYKKVKKIVAGPNDFISYTYNADKQVEQYRATWTFSPDGVITTYSADYSYSDGKVIEMITAAGGKKVFSYHNNRITHADVFNQRGVKYATHEYAFNAAGQLSEVVEVISDPLQVSHVRIRLEYNQHGNLTKRINDQKMVGQDDYVLSHTSYIDKYDNKWNPVPADVWGQHLPFLVMQKNNPIKIRDVAPDGTVMSITHISYQYNPDGYPKLRDQHVEVNGQHKPGYRLLYEY